MRRNRTLAALVVVVTSLTSLVAQAWTIQEDRGSTVLIRCADGSNSTVGQANGGWTVIVPGPRGMAGGQYAIVGQAAVRGCGE